MQQELILIMEKEYVALVLVVKCVQTHRNNLRYAFIGLLQSNFHTMVSMTTTYGRPLCRVHVELCLDLGGCLHEKTRTGASFIPT